MSGFGLGDLGNNLNLDLDFDGKIVYPKKLRNDKKVLIFFYFSIS